MDRNRKEPKAKVEGRGGDLKPQRPPNWERGELILALDLYFRHHPGTINRTHPEVIALSNLLRAQPTYPGVKVDARFRNANSVYSKLCNFIRFDPAHAGHGREHGNRLEQVIWDGFSGNQTLLRQVAEAIRMGISRPALQVITGNDEGEEEGQFPEGRVPYRMHRTRERNRRLVKQAKELAMRASGRLSCKVCQLDFAQRYGSIGEGFMECHHTKPLSEQAAETITRVADLALICSNCHRMVHRRRPWLTMDQLGNLLGT